MQLNRTYHTDMHLRDRIVQLFSAENDILLESFRDKPPETSNEAVQRIASRYSVIPGCINDKVNRREPSVLYVENVYRNKKKQRQTRRLDKSKAKCWVCGKIGHFARDMHTEEEIKSACSAGRNVSACISDLRQEDATLVLASEATYIDSKAEADSDHPDDNSSEVEGEAAHVNLVSAKLDEEPWVNSARREFNESITADAYDHAFIGVHSFSAYMRAEYDDMNMQLSGGSEGFGEIVMDTACTGASVCSEREYRRYCRGVGVEYNILPNSSAWVSFGDANKVTGQGRIRTLAGHFHNQGLPT
jgi:hypothetical protein